MSSSRKGAGRAVRIRSGHGPAARGRNRFGGGPDGELARAAGEGVAGGAASGVMSPLMSGPMTPSVSPDMSPSMPSPDGAGGPRAKKSLGQNFLRDRNIAAKIVAALRIGPAR